MFDIGFHGKIATDSTLPCASESVRERCMLICYFLVCLWKINNVVWARTIIECPLTEVLRLQEASVNGASSIFGSH